MCVYHVVEVAYDVQQRRRMDYECILCAFSADSYMTNTYTEVWPRNIFRIFYRRQAVPVRVSNFSKDVLRILWMRFVNGFLICVVEANCGPDDVLFFRA